MLIETLKELFTRDLKKLELEISSYENEIKLWEIHEGIKNSGGNLCLHIIGNLNTYIGVGLAKTEYVRHRDLEFTAKGVSKEKLIDDIRSTIKIVTKGLNELDKNDLLNYFPIVVWKKKTGMILTLLHLHSHLNYHLGQINYHRRLKNKL